MKIKLNFTQTLRRCAQMVFAGAVIAGAVVFVQSCTKESKDQDLAGSTLQGKGLFSSCGDPLKANTVLGLVRDNEDAFNHRVNMILYHYGQALKAVSQDPAMLCFIEESIIEDQTQNGVSLVTMAQNNPAFGTALNAALRQSINANDIYPRGEEAGIEHDLSTPNFDVNGFLTSRLVYAPYNYKPVIYSIPGIPSCSPGRTPYILIEQDVDDCDDVAGWHGEDEVVMSEQDVAGATDPVIFVGPGLSTYIFNGMAYGDANQVFVPESEYSLESAPVPGPVTVGDRADVDIDADLHQIKAGYRYESGDRSEISGIYEAFDLLHPSVIHANFWDDFKKDERKIHKNDINNSTTFYDDRGAFKIPASMFETGVSSVFFVTYEYDWYANKKDLVNPCFPSSSYTMWARMKYSHEWYLMKCGYGSSWFPSVGSSKDFDETKCRFKLKRTI